MENIIQQQREARLHTCCFTGHRPARLPWGNDEQDDRCCRLKVWLEEQIEAVCNRGITHFISGMAQGVDLYCCEVVLRVKARRPSILLEAAIPYPGQADHWGVSQRERYRRLLAQCDLETVVQNSHTPDCMMRRNRYMVDRASTLIAVYDGNPSGGTMRTCLYAYRQGLEVVEVSPEDF